MDLIFGSLIFESLVVLGLWLNRSGFFNRNSFKVDVGFCVGFFGSEFSEYEMFDELLGLEEDYFFLLEVRF